MRLKLILAIIGIAIIAAILALVFFFGSSNAPSTTAISTPSLPIAGSTVQSGSTSTGAPSATSTASMSVAARGGGAAIATSDFIDNGTTIPDPSNAGNYYLTGSTSDNFAISYNAPEQFFTIALDKEPIGNGRLEAQQFLLMALGISQSELCNINYYIGTIDGVNSFYAGKNLGFSFCPGAIELPN